MATTHVVHHRESHGNHPMSVVAFYSLLTGVACAGGWLVALASGGAAAPWLGIAALVLLVSAAITFRRISTHADHGPLRPENTDVESHRYLHEYRA